MPMSAKIMEQIKGHDKIKEQIKQALEKDRLPHALLFSGPSGVGKRQMAWALAQTFYVRRKGLAGNATTVSVFQKNKMKMFYV